MKIAMRCFDATGVAFTRRLPTVVPISLIYLPAQGYKISLAINFLPSGSLNCLAKMVFKGDVNVVCLKWGVKYPADYVNRLHRMVKRSLERPHRFVCLDDDPYVLVYAIST